MWRRWCEDFSAIHPEEPCGVFVLWKRGENLDYETVYSFDAYEFPESYNALSSITTKLQEMGVLEAEDPSFIALPKMIKSFENEFKWNHDESTNDVRETLKFLSEKKVDDVLFMRYVMKFLKEHKIRYEKGFSKSLLNGRFEHGLVSLEQLSRRFLFIYDENDQAHFLFPPSDEGEFYYMDEIPFYLEGNQSVTLYGERDFLKETGIVAIPESSAKDNMHSAQVVVDLNGETLESQISRKDNLDGFYSLLGRNASSPFWLNQWGVSPDSVALEYASLEDIYPYQLKFKQDSIELNVFERIDDSLGWFLPEKILPLGIYEKGEQDTEYGDYLILPFLKKDRISIFVKSDTPLQIAEEEKELQFENKIGKLSMKTYQMTDEVLKFDFEIEIKERYIEGDDVAAFKEFLQQYSELTTKKWVISL